jgi:hypothetical protein
VSKIPVSRSSANPAPGSSTRTRANTDAAPTHPPHEDSDDVSVTNSEVESVMNHRRLKETMRTPVFTEQEFTALSTVDAYIRAARDGLAGVAHLFSKDMQVMVCVNLIDICQ